MFFRNYNSNVFGTAPGTPSDEWCITTLRTMSAKYDHLSESRKVKPALAEAVLNSFKAKLSALYREHPLYDTDDSSEGEAEWPIVGDYSQYMDLKSNNPVCCRRPRHPRQHTIRREHPCRQPRRLKSPPAYRWTARKVALMSPSPSPTGSGDSAYPDLCSSEGKVVSDEEVKATSKGIDEALRRILSSTSRELLSMNFSTFPTSATASAEQVSTATTVSALCRSRSCPTRTTRTRRLPTRATARPARPPSPPMILAQQPSPLTCMSRTAPSWPSHQTPRLTRQRPHRPRSASATTLLTRTRTATSLSLSEAAPCGRAILVASPRKRARSATASDDNSVLAIAIPATGEGEV
ncbi:hypothetical protein DL89DRAFT_265689, partial [Linderina pennispora]